MICRESEKVLNFRVGFLRSDGQISIKIFLVKMIIFSIGHSNIKLFL